MLKSITYSLILFLLVPFIFGCSSLSKEQCMQGDWYGIGLQDGQRGYQSARMQDHIKACSEYGSKVDSQAYNNGHSDGLKTYCTPSNGYEVGISGGTYHQVCPVQMADGFLKNYRMGYKIYELRNDLHSIDREIDSLYTKIGDPKTPTYERANATARMQVLNYQKSDKTRELAILEVQAQSRSQEPGIITATSANPLPSASTPQPTAAPSNDGPISFLFDTYKPVYGVEEWVFEMTAKRPDGSKLPKRKYTIRLKANKNSNSIVNTHKLEIANSVGKFKTIDVDPSDIGSSIQNYYKQNPSEEWVAWLSGLWDARIKKDGSMVWRGNPGSTGSTLESPTTKMQIVSNCIWQGRQGYKVKVTGAGDEIEKCYISEIYFPTWSVVKKTSFEVEARLEKFDKTQWK